MSRTDRSGNLVEVDPEPLLRLRPSTESAADRRTLEALRSPVEAAPFNWFGSIALQAGPGQNHLFIELSPGSESPTVIGDVGWHAVKYGPNDESACFNIGITLFKPYRGRGFGTIAQEMLVDHLFATTTVNRIEAGTDVSNHAEQRALEKAGFVREGTARGAQFRQGEYHDLVIFSRLRD